MGNANSACLNASTVRRAVTATNAQMDTISQWLWINQFATPALWAAPPVATLPFAWPALQSTAINQVLVSSASSLTALFATIHRVRLVVSSVSLPTFLIILVAKYVHITVSTASMPLSAVNAFPASLLVKTLVLHVLYLGVLTARRVLLCANSVYPGTISWITPASLVPLSAGHALALAAFSANRDFS